MYRGVVLKLKREIFATFGIEPDERIILIPSLLAECLCVIKQEAEGK